MNIEHLISIADLFQFKLVTQLPQQVPGGPGGGHLAWKVRFDKEYFFIKQLDPKLNVHDKKIIARYELCESIAFRFSQQSIPAVYAIKNNNKAVMILGDSAYMAFPWIEGYKLNETSAEHAVKVAEILAKIHVINLDVPELEPKFDIHTNDEILKTLEKAFTISPISSLLQNNQKMILAMNDRYLSAIPILMKKTVITHGDVFQHNVVWQNSDKPFLIDWEAVKKWNPTREVIRTCIAWGGVSEEPLSLELFQVMLKTYIKFGGPLEKSHVEAALNGMYGSTINWLLYNIDLVCSNEDQTRRDTAINQLKACLSSGSKLTELFPTLYDSIC